jgi:hypothetical protein
MEATITGRSVDLIQMEEELIAQREQADAVLQQGQDVEDDSDPDPECLPCLIADLDD